MKNKESQDMYGPVRHLQDVCVELLGDHATQPVAMLAGTKPTSQELFRTCKEIENFTRLLVDNRKADELARRMREILRSEVLGKMKEGSS